MSLINKPKAKAYKAKPKKVELAKTPTKSELGTVYSPYQRSIPTPGSWTVQSIKGAISAHNQGQFSGSARLVEAMLTDSRLAAALETRNNGLFGSDFHFEPCGKDDIQKEQSASIIENLNDYWLGMLPEAEAKLLQTWKIMLGVGIAEKVWTFSAEAWIPTVRVWNPQFLSYDFNANLYLLQTKEGQVVIDPTKPNSKWIILTDGTNGFLQNKFSQLALKWLLNQWILNDMGRFSEALGMPIIKAIVPMQAEGSDKEAFFRGAKAIAREAIALLPQSEQSKYDLDTLEFSGDNYKTFSEFKRIIEVDYAIAILGQNLTTEINGSSLAAASVHNDIKEEIKKYDAECLSTQLHDQLLCDVVAVNWNTNIKLVPYPKWEVETPEDLKSTAESMSAGIKVITDAKSSNISVNQAEILERFNIPVEAVEEAKPGAAVANTEAKAPTFVLAPTDVAKTVTMNEARTASGLGPLLLPDGITPDPDGNLTITAYDAKKAQQAANIPAPAPVAAPDNQAVTQ